jgi:hypothetical protein
MRVMDYDIRQVPVTNLLPHLLNPLVSVGPSLRGFPGPLTEEVQVVAAKDERFGLAGLEDV